MGKIFGGSKSKSKSYNRSYDQINSAFSPLFGYAGQGAGGLAALLGGDSSGFDAFKKATGFDATAEMGSRGITGNKAASGLLRSGSTAKALQAYGDTIQNQFASDYMNKLLGLSGIGMQAGGLVTQAGQVSESKSKSKPGLGGFLGQVAGGIAASDRKVKKNIVPITRYGKIGIYSYNYVWDENENIKHVGVMADEVKEHYPEALGPTFGEQGFMTVDYDKLRELVEVS